MVISHDCEVDKFLKPDRPLTPMLETSWRFTVAVVHPVDDLTADRAGNARGGRAT
jgi:hypothetical protein